MYISVFGQLAFPFAIILSHTFFFLRCAAAAAAVSICNPDSLFLLSFLRYDYARYSLLIYFSFILYRHTFVCLFAPFPDIFSFCHTLFAYFAGLRIFRYSHRLPVFIDLIWRISFLALAPPF